MLLTEFRIFIQSKLQQGSPEGKNEGDFYSKVPHSKLIRSQNITPSQKLESNKISQSFHSIPISLKTQKVHQNQTKLFLAPSVIGHHFTIVKRLPNEENEKSKKKVPFAIIAFIVLFLLRTIDYIVKFDWEYTKKITNNFKQTDAHHKFIKMWKEPSKDGYMSPKGSIKTVKNWSSLRLNSNKLSESSPQNIEEKGDEIHKYVYYCQPKIKNISAPPVKRDPNFEEKSQALARKIQELQIIELPKEFAIDG